MMKGSPAPAGGAGGSGGEGDAAGSGGAVGEGGAAGSGGAVASSGGGGTGGTGGLAGSGGTDAGPTNADAEVADIAVDGAPTLDSGADDRDAPRDSSDAPDDTRDAAIDTRDAPADTIDAVAEPPPCNGYALRLDGTNYVRVARPVSSDFTLEAWIKTTSSLTAPATSYWLGRGVIYADESGSNNDFATSILNGKLAFGVGNIDTSVLSASNVTTGQWIHVAVTRQRSNGRMQVIINGALETSTTSNNLGLLDNPQFIYIGGNTTSGTGSNLNFIGDMDEVRMWTVVRTAAQITSTMHQRLNGNETGLVGYWRFDDPGTAVSSAPASNNGTLFGTPTWVQPDIICSP